MLPQAKITRLPVYPPSFATQFCSPVLPPSFASQIGASFSFRSFSLLPAMSSATTKNKRQRQSSVPTLSIPTPSVPTPEVNEVTEEESPSLELSLNDIRHVLSAHHKYCVQSFKKLDGVTGQLKDIHQLLKQIAERPSDNDSSDHGVILTDADNVLYCFACIVFNFTFTPHYKYRKK